MVNVWGGTDEAVYALPMQSVLPPDPDSPNWYLTWDVATQSLKYTSINTGVLPGDFTISEDLIFAGVGARITGDFSNTTAANRVLFQSSTVNGNTIVNTIPNGTATISGWKSYNSSDTLNASIGGFDVRSTDVRLQADAAGTGTYLPLTFYTSSSERMRLSTVGTLSIGNSNTAQFPPASLYIAETSHATSRRAGMLVGLRWNLVQDTSGNGVTNFALYDTVLARTRLEFDTIGNTTHNDPAGGLGYGYGAGGTVTQATSKSTAVTLNKPVGRVTTTADALGAGTVVGFNVNNSVVTTNDLIVINHVGGGAVSNYSLRVQPGTGVFSVYLKNESAGSLSDAITFSFAVIKGTTS